MRTLNDDKPSDKFMVVGATFMAVAGLRLGQDVLLAWMLPIGDFGRVATAITCSVIATTIGGLGFSEHSIRAASIFGSDANMRIPAFWRAGNLTNAVLPGPLAGMLFLLVTDEASEAEAVATGLLALLVSLVWFQRSVLIGLGRQVLGMSAAATAPGLAILMALVVQPRTGLAALVVLLSGAAVALVIGVLMVQQSLAGTTFVPGLRDLRLDQLRGRQLEAYLGGSASLAQSQVDLLVVSALLGAEAAGLYAAVLRLGLGITMVTQAAGFAYGPVFASHSHRGDYSKAFRELVATAKRTAAISAPIAIAIAVSGNFLLALIGPEYVAPVGLLIAVAGARWVNAATGPVGLFLVATGRSRSFMRINFISLAVVLVMLVPAGLSAQLVGVAIVSGIGIALQNSMQFVAARPKGQ